MGSILNAIDKYPDKENAVRLRALVLVLRYSGLRLGDAVTLNTSRIEDGRLFLKTEKTGTRVRTPLPESVIDALAQCSSPFPFWTGKSKKKSVMGNWQRALKLLFKLAGVSGGHAHRFRHTFAAELLLSGASLKTVAQALGHRSERIAEQHYSAWVAGRQEMLEAEIKKSWGESVITAS